MPAHSRNLARALLALGAAWLVQPACADAPKPAWADDPQPAWADDPQPRADAALRGWLEEGGLLRDLGYLRDHALQIADQQGCPRDLAGALREALEPAALFEDVMERLVDAEAAALLPPLEAFTHTPLGVRIAATDRERPQLDGEDAWRTGAVQLRQTPPDPGRAARIERVARASQGAELWTDAESRLRSALRDACLPAATGGRSQQEQSMLDAIDTAQGAQRRMHFLTTLSVVLYEGYKPLSDADLDAYAAFLESPDATRWLEARNAAIAAALEPAVRELIPPAPVPL
jgi:hypothetical protein